MATSPRGVAEAQAAHHENKIAAVSKGRAIGLFKSRVRAVVIIPQLRRPAPRAFSDKRSSESPGWRFRGLWVFGLFPLGRSAAQPFQRLEVFFSALHPFGLFG